MARKHINVMTQITRLILRIYLSTAHLMPKKQQVMSFSFLIHPDMRKSENLKLVAQIS